MPNLTLCYRIRLRRKNIEAAINLKGIDTDDFGPELFRNLDRERSFPNRSGSNNEERFVHEMDRLFSGQPYQRPTLNSKANRETGFRPRLPFESESTISSANGRSISPRSRPACGRGTPCREVRSPPASLLPRFAFARMRNLSSAGCLCSSQPPRFGRGRRR